MAWSQTKSAMKPKSDNTRLGGRSGWCGLDAELGVHRSTVSAWLKDADLHNAQ